MYYGYCCYWYDGVGVVCTLCVSEEPVKSNKTVLKRSVKLVK